MKRAIILVATFAAALTGCSSSVKQTVRPEHPDLAHLVDPAVLEVTVGESARKAASENLKFDVKRLQDTLQRALDAKGLLAKDGTPTERHVRVEVTDVRVRSNFSAVMFGFMAGNDHIRGRVSLLDGGEHPLNQFDVSAAYALGGFAGGQDEARMGWLYERFAEKTVDELTGRTTHSR